MRLPTKRRPKIIGGDLAQGSIRGTAEWPLVVRKAAIGQNTASQVLNPLHGWQQSAVTLGLVVARRGRTGDREVAGATP